MQVTTNRKYFLIYRSVIGAWSTTGTYILGERLMHAKLTFLNSHAIEHKVFLVYKGESVSIKHKANIFINDVTHNLITVTKITHYFHNPLNIAEAKVNKKALNNLGVHRTGLR